MYYFNFLIIDYDFHGILEVMKRVEYTLPADLFGVMGHFLLLLFV